MSSWLHSSWAEVVLSIYISLGRHFSQGSPVSLTGLAGERLGGLVVEDNRHGVFPGLPGHPGDVLDVVEFRYLWG